MKADDVMGAVAQAIDRRQNLVVPNVSWGLVEWGECDLLSMSGSGYLTEFEIKVSASDIKREWKKRRWTEPRLRQAFARTIKFYYMAVPSTLVDCVRETMPADIGGGIVVADYEWPHHVQTRAGSACWLEKAEPRSMAQPLTRDQQYQLARLGCFRYWSRFLKSIEG